MSVYSEEEEDQTLTSVQCRLNCVYISENNGDSRSFKRMNDDMSTNSMAASLDDFSPDQLIDYSKKYMDSHENVSKIDEIDLPSPEDETTDFSRRYYEATVADENTSGNFDPEQTPLMYSRNSSLKSITDCDSNEAYDDNGSYNSHCSHKSTYTPFSDLPDSPGHTLPPSPKSKAELEMRHRNLVRERQRQQGDYVSVHSSDSSLSEDEVDGVNESEILHKCLESGLHRSGSSSSLSEGCDDVDESVVVEQCLEAAGLEKSVPKQRRTK